MPQARDLADAVPKDRNWQLVLGVVAMIAASSPQYVWALFVPALTAELGAPLSAVQVTIAIFSICMCGLGPIHGFLAARTKTSYFVATGGILIGLSWVISARTTSLTEFYVTYGVLSGLGVGFVYVAVTDLMNQWFPDRRGFAVGMVAGGYGFGAILTTFPITFAINAYGYRFALVSVGSLLGVVCLLAALGMRKPSAPLVLAPATGTQLGDVEDVPPSRMLRTGTFWLLFAMMTMVGTGGLMVISQIAVFARHFGIGPTTIVLGMSALPLALTLDRLANGAARPAFGWISDRIGRENTMAIAFCLEAVSILALLAFGSDPLAFVLLSAMVFFGFGEIFSLFPSAQADLFGIRYSAQNFGFLLASIAVSSVLGGPLAALLFERTGSWLAVFGSVAAMDVFAALLAVTVLKPLRIRRTAFGARSPALT